jgi:hypothetical protein
MRSIVFFFWFCRIATSKKTKKNLELVFLICSSLTIFRFLTYSLIDTKENWMYYFWIGKKNILFLVSVRLSKKETFSMQISSIVIYSRFQDFSFSSSLKKNNSINDFPQSEIYLNVFMLNVYRVRVTKLVIFKEYMTITAKLVN